MNTIDPEFLKALELVAEFDRRRPVLLKEFRLYYREDGSIIGLWETDHPVGDNYIVIDNPAKFDNTNTFQLRVVNGQLTTIDLAPPTKPVLVKSVQGQPVVAGHAALPLYATEEYTNLEYYEPRNN